MIEFICIENLTRLNYYPNQYNLLVAEHFVSFKRIFVKIFGGIKKDYAGISSDKQYVSIVTENQRFL